LINTATQYTQFGFSQPLILNSSQVQRSSAITAFVRALDREGVGTNQPAPACFILVEAALIVTYFIIFHRPACIASSR
jgi:hypothetical protein